MDTDLLEFNTADNSADSGELYGDVTAMGRPVVPSSSGTFGKLNAVPDKTEPIDPPAPHCFPAQPPHYKSPPSVSDAGSAAAVVKPRPELPQRPSVVPAIPPRRPRVTTANLIPSRPDASLSKATQPHPPLPRIARKSAWDSFSNRMYDVSSPENQQPSLKQCSPEVNGGSPPVPIPRNVAAVTSEAVRGPASMMASASSPVPCDSLSSGERVSIHAMKIVDAHTTVDFIKVIGFCNRVFISVL